MKFTRLLIEEEEKMTSRSETGGKISVTPQMIRLAVQELHYKKVFVSSGLIAQHLQRCYPIESNREVLKREVDSGLEDAVAVGLVTKCGPDAYCLPTLRQQATKQKTDLTRFWETHNNNGIRGRSVDALKNPRKRAQNSLECDSSDQSDSGDENFDII